jgi:hypothetical protein
MIKGLGGMVWKLRDWGGGSPAAQVAQCLEYDLRWISIKIVNRWHRKWEGNIPNQNADLMQASVSALANVGITVFGWGYTYGQDPEAEAAATVSIMNSYADYGMSKVFQIDAEGEYNSVSMRDEAIRYSQVLDQAEGMEHMLCAYRFPLTYQPQFPVREFMHICEYSNPQVYFIGDTRANGGAIQLERSYLEYKGIKDVPFIGIAPTYRASGGWRASREQLRLFYEKAISLGHPAAGVWDLPQATPEQLNAFKDVQWPGGQLPPPETDNKAILKAHLDQAQTSILSAKNILEEIPNG